MSLKRSSIIHQMYVFKNIMELILLIFFIPINVYFAIEVKTRSRDGQYIYAENPPPRQKECTWKLQDNLKIFLCKETQSSLQFHQKYEKMFEPDCNIVTNSFMFYDFSCNFEFRAGDPDN